MDASNAVLVPEVASKPTILFVDDEQRVLKSMRAMFRKKYEVCVADSGAQALEIMAERTIDVVVSDQRMPTMTGVEVLTEIKNLYPMTQRILLTGYADLEAVEASMNEAEVFRYLMKPCPQDEIQGALTAALEFAAAGPVDGLGFDTEAVESAEIHVDPDTDTDLTDVLDADPVAQSAVAEAAELSEPASSSEPSKTFEATESSPPAEDPVPISEDATVSEPVSPEPEAPAVASVTRLPHPVRIQQPAQPVPEGAELKAHICVLSDDDQLCNSVTDSWSRPKVHVARTLDEVIELTHQQRVGVLVTDMVGDEAMLQEIVRGLSVISPHTVLVLASHRSDANFLIKLINSGKVFRFLLKPVHAAQCRIWLTSAARKFLEAAGTSPLEAGVSTSLWRRFFDWLLGR